MMPLDDAIAALQSLLARIEDTAVADVGNLWDLVGANATQWGPAEKRAVIAALTEFLPGLMAAHVGIAADTTAAWYDELAPAEPYTAAVPANIVPAERVRQSITWAVNTATTARTALSQLQGTAQRMVMDGQRETVAWNATREKVRYARHTNYAGACNWCLSLATRGAVYKTAASAVKGHDNCKCIAVPVRSGTTYRPPAMVVDAEKKYARARRELETAGTSPTLDNIVKQMDAIDSSARRAM